MSQCAGVARYTRLLVQHLAPMADNDSLVLFYFDFSRKGIPFEAANAIHRAVRWCPGRMAQLLWKTIRWPPFNYFAGEADIYHFPNFILPPLKRRKSVVTIHDMSFIRFPEFAEDRNQRYLSARIRDTVERADAIIADSQFSAREVQDLLHVDPGRIFPIHPGVDEDLKAVGQDHIQPVLSHFGIDRPYILTVGTLEPRKNIPFLVEVFEKLMDFDGYLVIVGMPGWKYGPVLERIETSSRVTDIRYLKYVDDSELAALYTGADLFILTSLYEGFGFPPLEAMACGTPVLSSSRGSLAEVLGTGAILMDQFDSDLWANRAGKVLFDSECRKKLIADGYRQASKYSWAETAQQTREVYRRIAGKNP